MPSPARAIEDRLRALRNEYASRLPDRIRQIEEAVEGWARGPEVPEALGALHRLVHSLVGSSGTFGHHALSRTARALEVDLKSMLESPGPVTEDTIRRVRDRVSAVRDARDDSTPTAAPRSAVTAIVHAPSVSAAVSSGRLVYLVAANEQFGADLATQLTHFGYTVRALSGLAALAESVRDAAPAAVVIDVGSSDVGEPSQDTLACLQQADRAPVPALFLSARGDLAARLAAVRAGASAYLTKPIDVDEVVDRLDILTTPRAPEPFRILIVDDSLDAATFWAGHLEHAGMTTAIVTDPMQVMGPLVDLDPDLVLMDLYMPGCSGLELASVIRQQKDFIGTPIVYLSAETDLDTRMEALRRGGDDFLTKPIQIEHLVSSVASRAQRSRILRALMIRDSLTGLLNHTATGERLVTEVTRAERQRGGLAYALIDLDFFKRVNDNYGHMTGDRVLIGLSRLLLQRLRKSDIIGRVGGEEFAIIFTDTDAATAARVLDEVRRRFGKVRHRGTAGEFYVTLSGGVAGFPAYADPAALNEAADRALYDAKHQGRDCVVLAP